MAGHASEIEAIVARLAILGPQLPVDVANRAALALVEETVVDEGVIVSDAWELLRAHYAPEQPARRTTVLDSPTTRAYVKAPPRPD
jgi:hypothetical protein